MAERINSVKELQSIIKEQINEENGLEFINAAKGMGGKSLILHFHADSYYSPSKVLMLQRKMKDAIGCGASVFAVVHQDKACLTKANIEKTVKEYIFEYDRTLEPHIRTCKIEVDGALISMEFDRQMAPLLLEKMEIPQKISNYFRNIYDVSFRISEMKYI